MHPPAGEPLREDWDLLLSFPPEGWEGLARRTGALRKLWKDKSPSKLLRTMLLHLGCGHSLRETVVRSIRAPSCAWSTNSTAAEPVHGPQPSLLPDMPARRGAWVHARLAPPPHRSGASCRPRHSVARGSPRATQLGADVCGDHHCQNSSEHLCWPVAAQNLTRGQKRGRRQLVHDRKCDPRRRVIAKSEGDGRISRIDWTPKW